MKKHWDELTYEEFLQRKSLEAGGGSFWAVMNPSVFMIKWARGKNDLVNHLSREGVKYTKLVELV